MILTNKLPTDNYVFICAGISVGDKIPRASAMFFTDQEEAQPEIKTCISSGWSIHYEGYNFKKALKTLKQLQNEGYLTNDEELEELNS